MDETAVNKSQPGPAGGWGSVAGIVRNGWWAEPSPAAMLTLEQQNKPGGHMCTGCAWGKPAHPHPLEFCENGAKATLWELTTRRCTPEFFADHTVSELLKWSDHDLENVGRLTHPMRYDITTDRYVACDWTDAFRDIGAALAAMPPEDTVFYSSGRASLETSYLYALFARLYGHNNLPDSSNMCHETTSVSLTDVIGSAVGTCTLDDFLTCDMILFFGQNTGSNSPRFLHPLQEAVGRGCRVVTFNPVREQGLISFINPQDPVQMVTGAATRISEIYLQVKPGGDIAALTGLCKHLLALDGPQGDLLDRGFLADHTDGFDEFRDFVQNATWPDIEAQSGLAADDLRKVAEIYATSQRVIGVYGMGLTQHIHGSQSIAMLTNLLFLRGNIGREGAGISPVRGHSNVQGQRTVGISEKPHLVPLDRLAEMFRFTPPRKQGTTTVDVVGRLLNRTLRAFISLGGNFARAIPDQGRSDPEWSGLDLNVQIATKLNRSHLLVGRTTFLLPCLARSEQDQQASGPQYVTMEDTFSHVHASLGKRTPASAHLLSEIAIVAGIAKATLAPNPTVKWDDWTADYGLVRSLIAETYPEQFYDFNQRMLTPGGFYRGNAARRREWKTASGRAQFRVPSSLSALGRPLTSDEFTLVTLRSNDQFNTTIYGPSDRLRGLSGSRDIVLINEAEMARFGLSEGQRVTLVCAVADGQDRRVSGLRVTGFNIPDGCVAAYYPEANALIPVSEYDLASKTPAFKGIPVRVEIDGRRG